MRAVAIILLVLLNTAYAADLEVEVRGIDGALRDNALAFLSIQQYRDRDDLNDAMLQRLHAQAPGEITRALSAFGHYRATVRGELLRDGEGWRAVYAVTPGPPVRLADVNVTIRGDETAQQVFRELLDAARLRKGEVLRHADYDAFKNALLNRATQHGYLDARFTVHRLEIDTDALEARVELELDTGARWYFGAIDIDQEILDDDFVRRYLEFKPGDPLNYDALLDLQFTLTDSEYFKAVEVNALRDQADERRRVPVQVSALPNERTRYTAGVGYGTDTGARITLGLQRRYVNRRGHRFAAEVQLSEIEDAYTARYTIPLQQPAEEWFQLFAGTLRAERADTESDRQVLGASRVRTLGDWEQTLYLRYEREDSILPAETFRTETLIPGASWQKVSADDLFYTRDGYKIYADLHGSHPALGSNTQYIQLHLLGKRIFPIAPRVRLLLRAEAGTTVLGETSQLPVSQRFFAGGDQSVRGYDYNRLGPRDGEGNVVGGQYFATGSAEIEYRFAEDWAIAAFTDVGNAMNDLDEELRRAAGLGLRWISPVGLVRLDVARPLKGGATTENGIEVHISVGPDL